MLAEFAGIGHAVSEPVGAVDAGDHLTLRKIQDGATTAERVDARLQSAGQCATVVGSFRQI